MNSIFVFILITLSIVVGAADNTEMPQGFYLIVAAVMFIGGILLHQADEERTKL